MINADLNAKIWLIKADVKMCLYGILVYVNVNKLYDFDEYLDYKNFKCKDRLIDKFALPWKDEVLYTTEVSFVDKRIICKKNHFLLRKSFSYSHCFIDNYMLIVITNCHFY